MPQIVPTFRLRTLFGVVTLVAIVLMVISLMKPAQSNVLEAVWLGGTCLAIVVAYRRRGGICDCILAAVLFSLGSFELGVYAALMSSAWQFYRPSGPQSDTAWEFLSLLLLMTPLTAGTLVLMFRAWVWSACDANSR